MDNQKMITMKEARRYQIISRLIRRELTEEEARKMIGLRSCRQIRRIKKRVQLEGVSGIAHRARGQPSNRKFSEVFKAQITKILKKEYRDFRPTLAWEKLIENHGIKISLEGLRQLMVTKGIWKPRKSRRRESKHVWRQRKANYGEMQQFDGSYHKWFEKRGKECCLLASIDDATGQITKACFAKNEGVNAVFEFWKSYNLNHGLPVSIYLDKFSTYKVNHKSAEDNSNLITQFERVCNQLDVNLIRANSPQAKGRIERLFETLQDRLVKEMRLAGVNNMEEGNEFLRRYYLPRFNEKFSVVAREEADIHRELSTEVKAKLEQIYSKQSERVIQTDYTVLFRSRYFQLTEIQSVTVYKKDKVTVEEHLNGEIKIRRKERYLSFIELPERPKRINVKLCALTPGKSTWKPPVNHPWRQHDFKINQKEKVAVS